MWVCQMAVKVAKPMSQQALVGSTSQVTNRSQVQPVPRPTSAKAMRVSWETSLQWHLPGQALPVLSIALCLNPSNEQGR